MPTTIIEHLFDCELAKSTIKIRQMKTANLNRRHGEKGDATRREQK